MHVLRQAGAVLHLPRRTLRTRLALLYGALFLGSGAVLLAVANLPLRGSKSVSSQVEGGSPGSAIAVAQHGADLRLLAIASIAALLVMVVLSIGFGWLMAGRLLRPLRTITATARDISATNLHERLALSGPDDEFKELGETLDDLFGRLEASFESQRHFVANASHELRTPITVERTLLQVALADPDASTGTLRSTCEKLLTLGEQEERLIEALLTLASSERGIEQREAFDLAAIAEKVVQVRRHEAEGHGISFKASLTAASVAGDPNLVESLTANLVDNALRHNVDGGRVDVATEVRAGSAVLSVVNTGPLVLPEDVERLFEPFRRAGADRMSSKDGHGLGLSIVQAVADAHGATITVDPQPNGGLKVEVSFPELSSVPSGLALVDSSRTTA
jgi:signal transduction histidine kinase